MLECWTETRSPTAITDGNASSVQTSGVAYDLFSIVIMENCNFIRNVGAVRDLSVEDVAPWCIVCIERRRSFMEKSPPHCEHLPARLGFPQATGVLLTVSGLVDVADSTFVNTTTGSEVGTKMCKVGNASPGSHTFGASSAHGSQFQSWRKAPFHGTPNESVRPERECGCDNNWCEGRSRFWSAPTQRVAERVPGKLRCQRGTTRKAAVG